VWAYTSPSTSTNYLLNTNLLKQSDAEQYCRDHGGHLAVYTSRCGLVLLSLE
jgi:hypothetical protein